MGKIHVGQTALSFVVTVSQDITGATSTLIKYIKPSGATGSFAASITDASTGEITYAVVDSDDIDAYHNWTFWANITFSDGKVAAGEASKIKVFKEGEL